VGAMLVVAMGKWLAARSNAKRALAPLEDLAHQSRAP